MEWNGVVVVNAQDFPQGGGTCTFTQLVKPDREGYKGNTSYPLGINKGALNGILGLDYSFDFGNEWTVSAKGATNPNTGEGGDSPAQNPYANPSYNPQTANESYTTYVMYKPPSNGLHQVWVPLQNYTWHWSAAVSWLPENNNWAVTSANPASTDPDPNYTGANTSAFPSWNLVQKNTQ